MPYVNDTAIPNAKNEYICWLDIMGTKSKMENTVKTCAIFILKLHSAVLEALEKGCKIKTYPVMDGVYITSQTKDEIENALFHIFSSLGEMFYNETNNNHKFLFKASVAFGPIIHGENVGDEVNDQFKAAKDYKESLLLGLPMIQAFTGEHNAPPFGVFIHESARAFYPNGKEPFMFKWWKWFKLGRWGWNKEKSRKLKKSIEAYFDFCEKNTISLDYPLDRIKYHRVAANEYFSETD